MHPLASLTPSSEKQNTVERWIWTRWGRCYKDAALNAIQSYLSLDFSELQNDCFTQINRLNISCILGIVWNKSFESDFFSFFFFFFESNFLAGLPIREELPFINFSVRTHKSPLLITSEKSECVCVYLFFCVCVCVFTGTRKSNVFETLGSRPVFMHLSFCVSTHAENLSV